MVNDKILELIINLVWPKIQATYGQQIDDAIKLAFSFKNFADELTARFERIENRLTNIERTQDALRRYLDPNGSGFGNVNPLGRFEIATIQSTPNSTGSGNSDDAGKRVA